jgi:hypothetical protein
LILALRENNTVVNGGNAVRLEELDISNNYIGNEAGINLYFYAKTFKTLIVVNLGKQNTFLDQELRENIEHQCILNKKEKSAKDHAVT